MKEPRRFWSKVDLGEPGECWEWLAGETGVGYGCFWINYRTWLAHRVAWVLTFGPIPEGLCVCHKCDNPSCVNPYHLFLGTHADNTMDAVEKGHLRTKLTKEDVLQVRELLEVGVLKQQIADEFGVSKRSIGDIKRGKFWSWLI